MKQMETVKNNVGMNWQMVKIPDVLFFMEGPGVRNTQFTTKGVKLLNVGNINDGLLDLNSTTKFISETEAYGKYKHFLVEEGDLLIASSGIVVDNFHNKITWAKSEDLPLCMNTSTIRFKTLDSNILDIGFFSYFLKTKLFTDQLRKLITGSAQLNFGPSHLKQISLPLPPLPIQKRIAEILDAADALKRKDQALLKKYDELAQSIFIDMFGDPVKNEKGWEVKKLKDICVKITDGTHFSPPNQVSGVPYITAKHLKKDVVDFYCNPTYISQKDHEDIFARCTPVKGDVLYIKDGATTGISAVNEYDFEFSMLSSLALIKPNTTLLNSYYLSCFLNNDIVKKELIRSYMAGAAIKRFTLDKINKFDIILPPIELQNAFETKWKKLRQIILNVKDSRSNDLFQNLIQKAFKGELVN
jgi:type I restriction enzyme, S subunit